MGSAEAKNACVMMAMLDLNATNAAAPKIVATRVNVTTKLAYANVTLALRMKIVRANCVVQTQMKHLCAADAVNATKM